MAESPAPQREPSPRETFLRDTSLRGTSPPGTPTEPSLHNGAAPKTATPKTAAPSTPPPRTCAPQPPLRPPPSIARPYFIPDSVDYEALPEAVRVALVGVVGPAYDDFVQHAKNPLERAAGITMVFLLTLEVLDQLALARVTDFGGQVAAGAAAWPDVRERQQLIESYLRLASAKHTAGRFMFHLQRSRQDPATATLRRPPDWPQSP